MESEGPGGLGRVKHLCRSEILSRFSHRPANRATLKHPNIQEGEWLSYLEIEKPLLTWAENYYIGTLRAWRNYGRVASHQIYQMDGS